MIHRQDVEAEVVRLIVTTREKFPHSVEWDAALKRVIWRYTGSPKPRPKTKRKKPKAKSKP
jgi:hypothetical protein